MKSEYLKTLENAFDRLKVCIMSGSINQEFADSMYALGNELKDFLATEKLKLQIGKFGIVETEEDYKEIIPKSYSSQYDYAAGKGSYPWLWVNFATKSPEDRELLVSINKNAHQVIFQPSTASIGTILDEGKTLKITSKNYFGFELIKDLGLNPNDLHGEYTVKIADAILGSETILKMKF